MEITLWVVARDGELFFQAPSGRLSDRLRADKTIDGGRLTIRRRGRDFDRGEISRDDDHHGYPHPAFLGLGHLYSTNPRSFDFRSTSTRIIDAVDLWAGDQLTLTLPRGASEKFNLDAVLRRQ